MPNNLKANLSDINFIIQKISIKESDIIAELGCGHHGYFVFPLARKLNKQGTLYAVDILPGVLDEIKKRAHLENLPQIKTVWANLENFKGVSIESSSVDTALIINVLNQSDKKVEILREAVRLIKCGGNLVVVDWKANAHLFGATSNRCLNTEVFRNIAPKLSLNIIEEFEVGEKYHAFILRKM